MMMYEDSLDTDGDIETGGSKRPAHVPAKFWDAAKNEIRTDALLRAYLDLEKRAFAPAKRGAGVPETADSYQISHKHPSLASSPQVNTRLHQAGFTQEQAQLVYDLAHDCLLPMLQQMAGGGQDGDVGHLCQHFGGETRWRQIAPQLAAWGKKNLPADAYQAMASSVDGVKALHRLMGSGEPALGRVPAPKDEAPSEDQLKKMIQDPRYWKTRDPAYIAKVQTGFKRIYGEG